MHLRQLAAKAPPSGTLLAEIGHNAGVVDIGQGYAVTFKIESHNHPSYVEPHQGAVTGGNVSFYNQTGTAAVHPTPVIGVLGVHAGGSR